MVFNSILGKLAGEKREFVEIDGNPEDDLLTHAEKGMEHTYGRKGSKDLTPEWDEVMRLMNESPGVYRVNGTDRNYTGEVPRLMECPGMTNKQALTFDVKDKIYSAFLVELAEPIESDEPFYVVGEAYEVEDEEFGEKLNYLRAERRNYDTPLSEEIERNM